MKIRVPHRLKENAWSAAGVLATMLGIFVATIVAYDLFYSEQDRPEKVTSLEVIHDLTGDLISHDLFIENRLTVQLDSIPIASIRLLHFSVKNKGDLPIRTDDYSVPLEVSIDEPWEFLNVTIDSDSKHPDDLNPTWVKISPQGFQLAPLLLNPGDEFEGYFLIFSRGKTEQEPKHKWSARIRPYTE